MGTLTSRGQFYKPAEVGEVVDIDQQNDNWDKADALLGAGNFTSGSRPPAPFNGQIIKESDTGRTLVWNGTNWVFLGLNELVKVSDLPAYNAEVTLGLTPTWTDVLSVNVDVLPGMATAVEFTGYIFNGQSGATRTAEIQFLIDGSAIGTRPQYYGDLIHVASNSPGYPVRFRRVYPAVGGITAGLRTFKMQGRASNAASIIVTSIGLSVQQGGIVA